MKCRLKNLLLVAAATTTLTRPYPGTFVTAVTDSGSDKVDTAVGINADTIAGPANNSHGADVGVVKGGGGNNTFGLWKGVLRREEEEEELAILVHWLLTEAAVRRVEVILNEDSPDAAGAMKGVHRTTQVKTMNVQSCNRTTTKKLFRPLPLTAVLVMCGADRAKELLQQVRQNKLESGHLRWLLLMTVLPPSGYRQALQEVLREGTQVTLIQCFRPAAYHMFTTFINVMNEVRFRVCGYWYHDPSKPENYAWYATSQEPLFEDIFESYHDFHGRELVVSTNNDSMFFALISLDNGTVVSHHGIDMSVAFSIAETLNFRLRVKQPPDGKWGGVLPNGTVIGLIGMAARRDAHMAIDQITITEGRQSVVDFSIPYFTDAMTLVTLEPGLKSTADILIKPFTLTVWLSFLSTLVISSVAVAVIDKISIIIARPKKQTIPSQNNITTVAAAATTKLPSSTRSNSFTEVAFNMLRSQLLQAYQLEQYTASPRVALSFWHLYTLNVIVYYSVSLTAMLSVPAHELPLDSLEDGLKAAQRDGFVISLKPDTSLTNLLSEAKSGTYQAVWNILKPGISFANTMEETIDMILKGNFGRLASEASSKFVCAQRGRRLFHIGRTTFFPQMYGMALPKGAPYIYKFNQLLTRMTEAGLVAKWTQDRLDTVATSQNAAQDAVNNIALSLFDTQAAFLLLLFGYSLAILALVTERLLWLWRQTKGRDRVSKVSVGSGGWAE